MLTREQVLYLRLEAEGVRLLPLAARREIAKKIESSPGIDAVILAEGSALVIEVKSVRQELEQDLRRLEHAEHMIVSDPEIMRGTPVYRGTRIPVDLVADMLSEGADPEEIIEGYPALDREKVELAPLYVQAFPRRGRPAPRAWAKRKPLHATRHGRALAGWEWSCWSTNAYIRLWLN
jgi:uncharacterized protein (DUF433 family)